MLVPTESCCRRVAHDFLGDEEIAGLLHYIGGVSVTREIKRGSLRPFVRLKVLRKAPNSLCKVVPILQSRRIKLSLQSYIALTVLIPMVLLSYL